MFKKSKKSLKWNLIKLKNYEQNKLSLILKPTFVPGVSSFSNPAYNDLLRQIKTKIKKDKYFLKDNPTKKSILRIALHSLGSPLWLPVRNPLHSLDSSRDLDMFIFCLRALVRSAFAVAVITIPSHLYSEVCLV